MDFTGGEEPTPSQRPPGAEFCEMMFWGGLVLPLALLSLCSLRVRAHHPDHLCMRRSFWKELIRGLESVNPVFSPKCRSYYDVNLSFPALLTPAENGKTALVVEILTRIRRLYGEADVPADQANLLCFLNRVSEILSHLRSCMKSQHPLNHHQSAPQERFQKLKRFLKRMGSNDCAWEIVHAVTRQILQEVAIIHGRK